MSKRVRSGSSPLSSPPPLITPPLHLRPPLLTDLSEVSDRHPHADLGRRSLHSTMPLTHQLNRAADAGRDERNRPNAMSCMLDSIDNRLALLSSRRGDHQSSPSIVAASGQASMQLMISPNSSSSGGECAAGSVHSTIRSDYASQNNIAAGGGSWPASRAYGCSFCGREFNSAQALGGHMNIHRRDRARLRCTASLTDNNYPPSSSAPSGSSASSPDCSNQQQQTVVSSHAPLPIDSARNLSLPPLQSHQYLLASVPDHQRLNYLPSPATNLQAENLYCQRPNPITPSTSLNLIQTLLSPPVARPLLSASDHASNPLHHRNCSVMQPDLAICRPDLLSTMQQKRQTAPAYGGSTNSYDNELPSRSRFHVSELHSSSAGSSCAAINYVPCTAELLPLLCRPKGSDHDGTKLLGISAAKETLPLQHPTQVAIPAYRPPSRGEHALSSRSFNDGSLISSRPESGNSCAYLASTRDLNVPQAHMSIGGSYSAPAGAGRAALCTPNSTITLASQTASAPGSSNNICDLELRLGQCASFSPATAGVGSLHPG